MDESRHQVLLAELEDARLERERLTAFIEILSDRLGIASDSSSVVDQRASQQENALPTTHDPSSLIYKDEFVGLSLPKAAEAVLNRFSPHPHQRPLKTTDLVTAIRKGGKPVASAAVLYRSLHKHSRFRALGRGMWGLSAWYPGTSRKAPRPDHPDTGASTHHEVSSEKQSETVAEDTLPAVPVEG